MNFRLTKGKIIASILIPGVIGVLAFIMNSGLFSVNLPSIINTILSMHNINNISSPMGIAPFVVDIIVLYLIISLFQRKKKEQKAVAAPVSSVQQPPYRPSAPYQPTNPSQPVNPAMPMNSPQVRIPPQQNL